MRTLNWFDSLRAKHSAGHPVACLVEPLDRIAERSGLRGIGQQLDLHVSFMTPSIVGITQRLKAAKAPIPVAGLHCHSGGTPGVGHGFHGLKPRVADLLTVSCCPNEPPSDQIGPATSVGSTEGPSGNLSWLDAILGARPEDAFSSDRQRIKLSQTGQWVDSRSFFNSAQGRARLPHSWLPAALARSSLAAENRHLG